ncbi:tRNA(Ile2) 2-agmatinylcytidine synthetase [Halocalculus aciditolerans]|uniref:tRNA(Ile2) 2-agmatinylcytidine synthetase TiaS n=2 Tax=Halocalculus aciditolerans TaxID=1383812 RepID=A0A830F859_9EURY|nr:tRNA(Ile2) 2-agmatinylcytidine synthetase [Halocalculus aciditolerans]
MCTTYVASRVARALRERGHGVERCLLVRLNPAVPYKTRGNAALAVHTDAPVAAALAVAREHVSDAAEVADDRTNPGVVVAPGDPGDVTDTVAEWARRALREDLDVADAVALADDAGFEREGWKSGRGQVGALAAVGAWRAFDDWTYEQISYRAPERWGTPRDVDDASVFAAADAAYPDVWDTVDRGEAEAVCVPHTPGPVLHAVRGDDPDACRAAADAIDAEPVHDARLFVTNQGTDAHLRDGEMGDLADGRGYRVRGAVASAPETREGGHVFVDLRDGEETLSCVAFEPTKRFRDRVRALRPGDDLTVCGEFTEGTLKLEKFRVHGLDVVERVVPDCPECGSRMESAGRSQGYRCRDCGTRRAEKDRRVVARDLAPGWYEVPPCARRHVAKPLVRGGFDAPTHPEG